MNCLWGQAGVKHICVSLVLGCHLDLDDFPWTGALQLEQRVLLGPSSEGSVLVAAHSYVFSQLL